MRTTELVGSGRWSRGGPGAAEELRREMRGEYAGDMSEIMTVDKLHQLFVEDFGAAVKSHSDLGAKPFDVDVSSSAWGLRVYAYNLTAPPGGRADDELKIQLIVPNQPRGERGNFEESEGRFILLAGYEQTMGVWVLWDASMYKDFAYSRNVQVKALALIKAVTSGLGEVQRKLKNGEETVVACSKKQLALGVARRIDLWSKKFLVKSS